MSEAIILSCLKVFCVCLGWHSQGCNLDITFRGGGGRNLDMTFREGGGLKLIFSDDGHGKNLWLLIYKMPPKNGVQHLRLIAQ